MVVLCYQTHGWQTKFHTKSRVLQAVSSISCLDTYMNITHIILKTTSTLTRVKKHLQNKHKHHIIIYIMSLESSPMFTHAIVKPDAYNRDIGRMSSVCTSTKSCNSNHNRPLSNLSSMWVSGDYDLLPNIPMLYPIERSSTIVDCDDPHRLAQRITDCLQKLSITAKCNNASEVRW